MKLIIIIMIYIEGKTHILILNISILFKIGLAKDNANIIIEIIIIHNIIEIKTN
jgi:hypothetical protein